MHTDDDACGHTGRMVVNAEDTSRDRLSKSPNYPFEVLTTDQIVQYMADCIKDVNSVVEIPATTTRILLNHFKWDKEKLIEKYYDGDQEAFFKAAHVINPFNESNVLIKPGQSNQSQMETKECEICFCCIPPTMMTGLECGHKFCTNCWREYLTTKIMEEGLGESISCAAHGCGIIVDDVTVMKLVTDAQVKLKYQHLITNNFVECNRLLRWCPSPTGCTYAIKVTYAESYPVECKCGHTFCFKCGENWHDPVLCIHLKKWLKKCNDDSETANWIVAHTKDCPKCGVPIEKNGGCNYILCRNPSCKHEFCYICLNPLNDAYAPHAYRCNQFKEDEKEEMDKKKEKSRLTLARYIHYFNRYSNHMQSMNLEHNLYELVDGKMEELQKLNMSWIDVQFLKKAVDILCQCRQTLMYTHAFAYYLEKNNQSIIFETNQSDLEMATEKLSEYLEREMTSEELLDIKQKVIDKSGYCERRRKVLLDHVHEGYENDSWDFAE